MGVVYEKCKQRRDTKVVYEKCKLGWFGTRRSSVSEGSIGSRCPSRGAGAGVGVGVDREKTLSTQTCAGAALCALLSTTGASAARDLLSSTALLFTAAHTEARALRAQQLYSYIMPLMYVLPYNCPYRSHEVKQFTLLSLQLFTRYTLKGRVNGLDGINALGIARPRPMRVKVKMLRRHTLAEAERS